MQYKPLGVRGMIANSLNEFAIENQQIRDLTTFINTWGYRVGQVMEYDLSDPEIFSFVISVVKMLLDQPLEDLLLNRDIERHMEAISQSYQV